MTADEARTHIRYSGWASHRLLDAALNLDPEQLSSRSERLATKSCWHAAAHLIWRIGIWLARVVDPPGCSKGAIELDWPQTQQYWPKFAAMGDWRMR